MIFEDPSHRRWRRAVAVFSLLAVAALAALAITLTGGFIPPRVPNPFSSKSVVQKTLVKASLEQDVRPVYTAQQKKRMQARAQERKRRNKLAGDTKGAMPLPPNAVIGFMTQDDPYSVASLERHIASIDVVVPDWYELPGPGCNLVERIDDKTRRVLSRSDVIVLPRLANLANDQWRSAETSKFLADNTARACLIKALVPKLVAIGAEGLNLDIEMVRQEDSEAFLGFIVELRAALHAKSMRLTVDVPVSDPAFDYEYIGDVADAVMVMAYDQHESESKPGPIASKKWFDEALSELLPKLPPDRAVVILGNYGYDWTLSETPKPVKDYSFREVVDLARVAGAVPVFEEGIENVHFGYTDDGETHEVWFEDALTAYNEVKTLESKQVTRIGLWRLGTEDETLWSFLGADVPVGPQTLASVPPVKSVGVGIYGEGEVYMIRGEPQSGSRSIAVSEDGSIGHAVYDRVPSGFVVEKRGGKGKQVALTFDDGPDEQNTPLLLDVLKALKVPAAFFVVGEQAVREPDLVVREAEEGHLVGNHSYTHPHLEALTPREAAAELAETQRLIEGLTGHRSPLFRAPYIADIDLEQQPDLAVLRIALQHNYLYVGANVDPSDWEAPNVDAIVSKTISNVTNGVGKIIVCHDGGGDRSKTISAVRRFVPELRKRGYEFVSLDKLLGIGREELAAPVPPSERLLSASDAALAYARGWGWTMLAVLFFVCTVLSILRILFLGTLTIRDLRNKAPEKPGFEPLVTVIVPAFNEAKVILTTLRSILSSRYKNLEILVVDDGSTDDTVAVVTSFVRNELSGGGSTSPPTPRVRIVSQANAGKAAAANRALAEARGEIVVAVDADTIVSPDAIPKMVVHFSSPDVTAVCGNVEVGNVNGIITAFQAIEYVTSQNFDRRAFSALNCISVVPGALGAWRRDAVLAAGGYSHETLTEDADLTLTILDRGGKVVYEPEAYGRTEAPESLGALLRQRFRWTYGTYQCLWKHRSAFFKGTLGWVGLPNMVVFQVVFPLLSPIGDIMMVASVFRGDWRAFLVGYVAFLAMDICGSLLAFTLDRKPLRWLPLLLVQRFSYRQIMYYVCFKAMIAAVRGARHGWRKLDRTGALNSKELPSRPEAFGNAA